MRPRFALVPPWQRASRPPPVPPRHQLPDKSGCATGSLQSVQFFSSANTLGVSHNDNDTQCQSFRLDRVLTTTRVYKLYYIFSAVLYIRHFNMSLHCCLKRNVSSASAHWTDSNSVLHRDIYSIPCILRRQEDAANLDQTVCLCGLPCPLSASVPHDVCCDLCAPPPPPPAYVVPEHFWYTTVQTATALQEETTKPRYCTAALEATSDVCDGPTTSTFALVVPTPGSRDNYYSNRSVVGGNYVLLRQGDDSSDTTTTAATATYLEADLEPCTPVATASSNCNEPCCTQSRGLSQTLERDRYSVRHQLAAAPTPGRPPYQQLHGHPAQFQSFHPYRAPPDRGRRPKRRWMLVQWDGGVYI